MNYQIKGNFNYHLEILSSQLNETTNITINAFSSKINQIPLGCKFQWFKKSDNERIKIETQGNIYPCSIFDIGYKIEAVVQPFESGYEGQAIIEFQKIQISSQLENKLSQLYHNNMKQQINCNDQNWIFSLEYLENSTNQQKIQYGDQCILSNQNQLQVQFNNQIMKFKCKEDKDAFCAFFISMQSLKRVHLKFIAYNIGKLNQKQVNFQSLLNAQLLQLINEKSVIPIKKFEPIQNNIMMATSQDFRTNNQIQITQLKQEVIQVQNEKQKLQQQIDKLIKENKELEINGRSNTASKDQLDSMDRLIQSLKNEVYSLKQRETDLMNQNNRLTMALNEKNDKCEKSLSQSQFIDELKLKQYQDMLQECNNEKLRLQEELNKYQKFGQSSRTSQNNDVEKERLIQVNQKLMQEIATQTNKIKELQLELEMMKNMSRISMSMSMMEDPVMKTKIEQLEQENQYLQKKISILEEELSKKKQPKPQKQQQDKDLQIQKLTEANKRYLEENLKLFEEIRQLREKFDYSSILQGSMKDSQIQDNVVNNQLEQQIERMQQIHNLEIQKMKKKIEKLTNDLQDSNQIKKQFEQLIKQNKRLVEENTNLTEQIRNLADINLSKSFSDNMFNSKIFNSDQYKELEQQLIILKRKNDEIQSKLDIHLQKDIQQLDKIKILEQEIVKYKNQIREIQYNNSDNNEVKLLQNQIDDYQKTKDNLMRENIQLRDDYSTLMQDKEYLNGKIKQLENSIFELKQKQMQLQEENRTLKLFPQSAERQFNIQIQQLQTQNKNLTEEIVRLQSQGFKDLNQSNLSISESILGSKIYEAKEYKLLENQKELLFNENQQLKLEIRQEQQKINDINKFQEQIKSLQNDKDILNQQLISNKEQHSRQIITLQNQIDKLNQQLQNKSLSDSRYKVIINDNKLDDNNQKQQQEILKLENENRQLNQQIQLLQLQYDTEIRNQQTQLSDLQFENNKLKREITYSKQYSESIIINQTEKKQYQSQDNEIAQLKNQLADKTHQLKIIQTNSQNNMEELQQVISKLGLENKNINEVHNSIKSRLETQINKLIEQLREKDQNIIKIQEELRKKDLINKQQEEDLFMKSNQVEQLIQQNKGLALQLNNLNFELQELRMASLSNSFSKSHIDIRENENQELQNEIQTLRNQIQIMESQAIKQQDNSKMIKLEDEIANYQREIQLIKTKLQVTIDDSEFYKREFIQSQQQVEKMKKEYQLKQFEKLSIQENELIQIKKTNQELNLKNQELSIIIQKQQQQMDDLQLDLNDQIEDNNTITKLKMQLQQECEKLQRENQQLNIKIQELLNIQQIGKDKELSESLRKLQLIEQEKSKLNLQYEQQQKIIENLKNNLEISQNKKDEFEVKLHSSEQYKQELQILLKEKDQKIKQLQQESQYLSKELDNEQQKQTNQKKKVSELTIQIQNKDNDIQQQIIKVKNLEEQIQKNNQQINSLNKQISQLSQENNKYLNEIIPNLNKQINQETLEKDQLHQQFEILQEQFTQMEQQILSITREKSPVRSKNNSQCKPFDQNLNEKITQQELTITQKNQIIEQQQEKIKILTQQNNGLLNQINKLNDDLREIQDRSFSLDRSSETYLINKSFNSKFNTDNDLILQNQYQSQDIYESDRKRQSQYQQYEQTLQEYIQENKNQKQEIDQLKQVINKQKVEYEQQIQNISNSNQLQISELNSKLEKLIQEDKKNQILPSQNLRNEYQQQIDKLEEELFRKQGVEQSNQRLNNEIRIQITKVVELQKQLDELLQQNQQLNEQIQEQDELIKNLQKMKIQNLDSSDQQKEGELSQLTQQLQDETLILKEQNQKYEQQISEYQSKIETLENEIQRKSQQLSLKDSQVNQNNRKNKKLEEQIQLLQDQLKGQGSLVTQNKDEIIIQLQNELEQNRAENLELQKLIKQLEEQIDRLTKSNSALMEENCRLNDQIKDNINVSYLSNDSQNH